MKVKLTLIIEGDIEHNGIHPSKRDDINVTIDLLSLESTRRRLNESEMQTLEELFPAILACIPH